MQKISSILRFLAFWPPAAILVLALVCPAQARDTELQQLNQRVVELRKQGNFKEATVVATQALEVAEKSLGPNHADVAASLNNLAELYLAQGLYAQADPLIKRALAIRETSLGPDHPDVAASLNNLGALYQAQDRYAQADPLIKRALAIREKSLGPDHPDVAASLNNLAELYLAQGQYAQAGLLFKRALVIRETSLGPDHPDVAASLINLAQLYQAEGQYGQAELLFKRAIAIRETSLSPDHPDVAASLINFAALYQAQGQYPQAEPLLKRAVAILEKSFGPDHPDVAASLNNRAALHHAQGQYPQAVPLLKRAVAIWEKSLGTDHPDLAASLNNLAELYHTQGQYAHAEPLLKRALAIRETSLGPDHPDVAISLSNLAELYRDQGQYTHAEPLLKRALAIRETSLGPDHPDVAISLNNLARLYRGQGQYAHAEPLLKRALAIREASLGPAHPDVASSLNSLAALYHAQGKYPFAEPLYKRALTIWEKSLGPDHPDVATSLNNLAALYYDQGQYSPAEPLFKRALAIREKSLGTDHPLVAASLNKLAALYRRQKQYSTAIHFARGSTRIYRNRIATGGTGDAAVREAATNQDGFANHLFLLAQNPDKEADEKITDESLQVAQLVQSSGTASAVAKMAERFASGGDELAALVKRKQDAVERIVKQEGKLVSAAGRAPQQRNPAHEQLLREDIGTARKEVAAINTELTLRFPHYQELSRVEPLTVTRVRGLLKPGEAMLVYALGESNFAWVVKPETAIFKPLTLNVKDLATKVVSVRAQLELDSNQRVQNVSLDVLHDLYQAVLAPLETELSGVNHLMLVPAGPLQSLSFAMLVTSPPPRVVNDADYRQVDWLVKRFALSVLPSVGSIQALRQFAQGRSGQEPFAGFGDPSIGGRGAPTRRQRAKIDVSGVFRSTVAKAGMNTAVPGQGAEIADVETIRRAPSLPETADELRAMARGMKADQQSLWLGQNATETNVKRLDLSRYRTLAFATHGVMAGEVNGVGEPGLILTPPAVGTPEDDGYLASGEIAKLKLNADWVILSACNTAAADGTPGAEGMSGMAKAFFYAGARSLLVSHWSVASEATVPLTTSMLGKYEASPKLGKAQAQRKAMLELMNTQNHPEYAHPLFWAPFVVVGEGGAGTL
jgi:tetratricopeptide (TPR) repeat protein/CHAT domain-containing protein